MKYSWLIGSVNVRARTVALALIITGLCLARTPVAFAEDNADSQTTAPAAKTPADDAATQTRVRELIYVLRGHRVFERCDEWGAAIRELSEIGPAALPELLLELKNTQRGTTMRGLLFTLRAIDDPRTLPLVIEAIPKATQLSDRASDCGVVFLDEDLHRFMMQHEKFPHGDEYVGYGRPVSEIISTLHKLSNTPLPDLTNEGPHPTWNSVYWQQWWENEGKAAYGKENKTIELPKREEDLVERDGVRRFGPLFPTGPKQRLSPVVEVTLANQLANAPSCLDLETGEMYEIYEGLRYTPGQNFGFLDYHKWAKDTGVDITMNDLPDLHLWLIENDRWDSLDQEVQSEEPLDVGREAFNFLTPFGKDPWDLLPDQVGTFLFTTREGSRGVVRAYPLDKKSRIRKIEYRLWNRDEIEPSLATKPLPRTTDEWRPAKIVILKRPDYGVKCLYCLQQAKVEVLLNSIFKPGEPLLDIEELTKKGGVFWNEQIANWAREQGIDLTFTLGLGDEADEEKAPSLYKGKFAALMLLDGRISQVTADAFEKLTAARAREILDRSPNSFSTLFMTPELVPGSPPATYLFETKSGLLGILQILKVGNELSSISFRYELVNSPEKQAPEKN